MSAAHNLATAFQPTEDELSVDDRQYTPGFSDQLGDRVTYVDAETKTSFEMLRFKAAFGEAPGFEDALRASVETIGLLRSSSLTTVREVERVGEHGTLTLVSVVTEGRRLADLMPRARGTALAVELVQEIGPVLAALHQSGHVHGALTPERIVVSLEGRPTLTEHVLGAAIASLALPGDQLRSMTGIAVPGDHVPGKLDPRIDVIQLGFIVLSLLLGRSLAPADYPNRLTEWLDEFSRTAPDTAAQFRPWLERALQIGDRSFATALDALAAFEGLSEALPSEPKPEPMPDTTAATAPVTEPEAQRKVVEWPGRSFMQTATPEPSSSTPTSRRATAVLGLVVLVQAVVIGYLYVANVSIAATSLVIAGPALAAPAALMPAPPAAELTPEEPAATLPAAAPIATVAPGAAQFGGMTLAAAIELQVFENGKLLGTTGSPIAIAAGTHVLVVVNEAFGFRARQTVEVGPGQMASVRVTLPKGRVNINAAPWADVQIDGVAAGQTPLANLALTIGEHEIIFSHPQFGEQRQTAVVNVDGITRVTAVFKQ